VKRKAVLRKQVDKVAKRDIQVANPRNYSDLIENIKLKDGKARVCIVRSVGGIGDVLMTTPALRQLKQSFPQITLVYAVDRHRSSRDPYWNLVKNAPFIDEIIDARFVDRSKFDAVVDISSICIRYEHKALPPLNRIDLFARALGMNYMQSKVPFYKVEPAEKAKACSVIAPMRSKYKYVVALHTASFDGKRSWPASKYVEMLKYAEIHNPEIGFLLFDFNRVMPANQFSNVIDCSDTTVREMAALIKEADILVGPDSGPMHIAGAVGTPAVVAFGAIPPQARINYYPGHSAVVLTGLGCLGCWYAACPINTKCMTDLKMITVYEQMIRKLVSSDN
jgi:ADP-heptose:LPS heptosyltransferase